MTDRGPLKKLEIGGVCYETHYTAKFAHRRKYVPGDPGKLSCVIPGIIQKVLVSPGKKVVKGEPLLVLEAMKMQNDICAPCDGRVKSVFVKAGKMVTKGELLLDLE
jgi:biotin carboxyl carrier protein